MPFVIRCTEARDLLDWVIEYLKKNRSTALYRSAVVDRGSNEVRVGSGDGEDGLAVLREYDNDGGERRLSLDGRDVVCGPEAVGAAVSRAVEWLERRGGMPRDLGEPVPDRLLPAASANAERVFAAVRGATGGSPGSRARVVYVVGQTGVGKSVAARLAFNRLNAADPTSPLAYLSCRDDPSVSAHRLLDVVGRGVRPLADREAAQERLALACATPGGIETGGGIVVFVDDVPDGEGAAGRVLDGSPVPRAVSDDPRNVCVLVGTEAPSGPLPRGDALVRVDPVDARDLETVFGPLPPCVGGLPAAAFAFARHGWNARERRWHSDEEVSRHVLENEQAYLDDRRTVHGSLRARIGDDASVAGALGALCALSKARPSLDTMRATAGDAWDVLVRRHLVDPDDGAPWPVATSCVAAARPGHPAATLEIACCKPRSAADVDEAVVWLRRQPAVWGVALLTEGWTWAGV